MAFHIAMLKIMLEEKSTSCETLSVKVFKEGWRNGRGGGFGHWRCWLPGFALNQPGHPRTNLLLVTMGCRFVFLISAGLFQEALRLQRDAGTLGRCLIQLGHGSAALLKMGCPAVPRCLQFVRLGVSVWLFFLQKPKGFAEPTTALLQFQSPEQHFPFPSNKEKQCSCSAQEMPNADLHHISEPGTIFLSGSASSSSSPSCREHSWPFLPIRSQSSSCTFPSGVTPCLWGTGAAQGVDHGLREAEGWNPAQQSGGWPGRLGASSICEQTHQCPLLAWQRTALKSIPCGTQGVPRASSRKGQISPSDGSWTLSLCCL